MDNETLVKIKDIIDKLNTEDVYSQPIDSGHLQGTIDAINYFREEIIQDVTILDIGCNGNTNRYFEKLGLVWTGINLGEDYKICNLLGLNVIESDMTFLNLPENSHELGFARHVLEHSPMPLITLINWNKILSKHLLLILPSPEHYKVYGRNHYSVLYDNQWRWLLSRSGWRILKEKIWTDEYWFYCMKDTPRKLAPYEETEYDDEENKLT